MTMFVSTESDRTTFWLEGEHDISTVVFLDKALADAEGGDITVDLSGVTFIDTTTIYALGRCRDRCEAEGHQLTIRHPSVHTARVLKLCSTSLA